MFVALEVKRSRNVHHTDLRALKAFQADYPEATVCLLYMGTEELKICGVCIRRTKFCHRARIDGACWRLG